jgi:diguanylate cyclase (GGDEF)-like protein
MAIVGGSKRSLFAPGKGLSAMGRSAVALACVAAISLLDYWTDPDLSFSLFYFGVLAFYAWNGAKTTEAVWAAIGIAFVWCVAEWYTRGASPPAILLWNAGMRAVVLVALGIFVCRLRRALNSEQLLARTDFLTGALNARAFAELAQSEIARARRYQHVLAVAYLDLDDFKQINDRFGHSYGDEVLRIVVRAVRSHLRASDGLARVGGDEFVALLPETGAEQAEIVLGKIHSVVSESMRDHPCAVTFSIGAFALEKIFGSINVVVAG